MPKPPQHQRLRVDFGDGPSHPVACYTADPGVIARLVAALAAWNSDYRVTVESCDDIGTPPLPTWRLWTCE